MRRFIAWLCVVSIMPGNFVSAFQDAGSQIPPDQLDSLVAPIALYPDPLLAQTLAASTYPLEVLELQQWLAKNPGLKGQALADAVARQPWDPTVQALAALPEIVKRLADDIQWTSNLGNAFLTQQSDVMDAVQRMRQKAEQNGQLKSGDQQRVDTQVIENKTVIVIEPASPDVVYVPSYNPTVVYGPPVYPYPPIYYPPPGAYAAGLAISWGVGVAMGAFWGGGGWGWNAGWGHNNININNNNFFNRSANVRAGNAARVNGTWQHNAAHRGGTPYSNRATANRFGGTTRGDSLANRQATARQQINRQGGAARANATGTGGLRGGSTGAARPNATGTGGLRGGSTGAARPNATGTGGLRGGSTGAARPNATGTGALGNRPSGGFSGSRPASGADRIGNRDLSRTPGGNANAFSGGSQRFSGSSARSDSMRGRSSLNSSRSGGGFSSSRSGGGFSGGGARRGGGGGSRGGGRRGGGRR